MRAGTRWWRSTRPAPSPSTRYARRLTVWPAACSPAPPPPAPGSRLYCCSPDHHVLPHTSPARRHTHTHTHKPLHSPPLPQATIVPRGHALGMVSQVPDKDEYSTTRQQMMAHIDVCMGGKAAEELIFGEDQVTSGATSDLRQATRMARHMVVDCGMSDRIGPGEPPLGALGCAGAAQGRAGPEGWCGQARWWAVVEARVGLAGGRSCAGWPGAGPIRPLPCVGLPSVPDPLPPRPPRVRCSGGGRGAEPQHAAGGG